MCGCFHMCRSNQQEKIVTAVMYLKEQTQREQTENACVATRLA